MQKSAYSNYFNGFFMINFRNSFLLMSLLPSLSMAASGIYYTRSEFPYMKADTFVEKIFGRPFEEDVVPKDLQAYEKDQELYSGCYVLNSPLHANEILMLSDGPFFATVWRYGYNLTNELKALAVLSREEVVKQAMSKNDYYIMRLRVYTQASGEKPKAVDVYKTPGLRINEVSDCEALLNVVKHSGYKGKAFGCLGTMFQYVPVYSYDHD